MPGSFEHFSMRPTKALLRSTHQELVGATNARLSSSSGLAEGRVIIITCKLRGKCAALAARACAHTPFIPAHSRNP